jgi:hypothetical protein
VSFAAVQVAVHALSVSKAEVTDAFTTGGFMNGLLQSRKFFLALFGVVQALVLQYLDVPDPVWQSIVALVMTLIAGIAVEDAAEKRAPK